jgi:hypothetical protein
MTIIDFRFHLFSHDFLSNDFLSNDFLSNDFLSNDFLSNDFLPHNQKSIHPLSKSVKVSSGTYSEITFDFSNTSLLLMESTKQLISR